MIRLACQGYDRGDYDGTTLEKALDDGWEASAKNKPTRIPARNTNSATLLRANQSSTGTLTWVGAQLAPQTTAELPS